MTAINLKEKLGRFDEHWSPKKIAEFNSHDVMVVKVKGEFQWHSHSDTDDFMFVIRAALPLKCVKATFISKKAKCMLFLKVLNIAQCLRKKQSYY